ncbi:Hypothetical protein D9617_27g044560 [Elsinoe fawcettii]|nr:Hypothetical protein D9617_27g044560 [Elsinoe fawcettii]
MHIPFFLTLIAFVAAVNLNPAEKACRNLKTQTALTKESAQHPVRFCKFYLLAPRQRSPFPALDAAVLTRACACILKEAGATVPKGSTPPSQNKAVRCNRSNAADIKDEYKYPLKFCQFHGSSIRSFSAVPGLAAIEVARGCKCMLDAGKSTQDGSGITTQQTSDGEETVIATSLGSTLREDATTTGTNSSIATSATNTSPSTVKISLTSTTSTSTTTTSATTTSATTTSAITTTTSKTTTSTTTISTTTTLGSMTSTIIVGETGTTRFTTITTTSESTSTTTTLQTITTSATFIDALISSTVLTPNAALIPTTTSPTATTMTTSKSISTTMTTTTCPEVGGFTVIETVNNPTAARRTDIFDRDFSGAGTTLVDRNAGRTTYTSTYAVSVAGQACASAAQAGNHGGRSSFNLFVGPSKEW